MINNIFSPFLFQKQLQGHSDYKKNLLPTIFEEYFKKNGSNTEGEWGCDCFTTFFDRDFATYEPLKLEIQQLVRKMFEELEMKPCGSMHMVQNNHKKFIVIQDLHFLEFIIYNLIQKFIKQLLL